MIFPVLVGLNESYAFRPVCDVLEAYAAEKLQLPVHDLLDAFRGEHAPDLWVAPLDQHPNERAHAIADEPLLPFVAELLLDAP